MSYKARCLGSLKVSGRVGIGLWRVGWNQAEQGEGKVGIGLWRVGWNWAEQEEGRVGIGLLRDRGKQHQN